MTEGASGAGSVAAIVVAAGAGRRLSDGGIRKQYREIAGEPMLARALRPFLEHPGISKVVAVIPPEDVDRPPAWLTALPISLAAGGRERTDSVRGGLMALDPDVATVLVHDGARPFVTRELIDRVLGAASEFREGAVIPGERMTDTIKEVGSDGVVVRTVARDRLWSVQTPQAFPVKILRRLHEEAAEIGYVATDDAMLFEWRGVPVRVVNGDANNIKVTTARDLVVAEVLAARLDGTARVEAAARVRDR